VPLIRLLVFVDAECSCTVLKCSCTDLDETTAKCWKNKRLEDILDTVDPFDVRPYLFEKDILSLAEYEETLHRRDTYQPIINVLHKHAPSDFPFTHLKLALKERYPDLVEKIDASTVGKVSRNYHV
jgi:hypothetical protein